MSLTVQAPARLSWLHRHPLLAFFAWFFTVGQAFALAPHFVHTGLPDQVWIIGASLVGLLLPNLVITRLVDGPDALKRMVRSFVDWRHGPRWYLLAVLVVPVVATALAYLFLGVPADVPLSTLAGVIVVQFALNMFPNNWAEEGTWSGFIQARIQKRHGAAWGAVITAQLFTLQHISLVLGGPLMMGVLLMVFLSVMAIGYRFLTGYLWNRTGSLLLAGLVHATANTVATGSGFGDGGVLRHLYPGSMLATMIHLVAAMLVGLAILLLTRGRLGLRRTT
ncbi:CPBP family intramembrane metalloprotease [Actinoplanes bogorensis]|uniref:CPBP family intramembrane metalloprotease n=1 Tax=Paractinoplanes bogorensis TaxID=1610840 RepID=A0ABS5YJK6_9ACTN|nr:CPBP family intramembrane glutamic endopeptidase [Actinoplanes bogorensis]MBU2663602.1 CPBP family intramembrane metalloprotease [Actinoplanes bogorensis]